MLAYLILQSFGNFEDLDSEIFPLFLRLSQPLLMENYSQRFSALLHLEEIQMDIDIRMFDMERVSTLYHYITICIPYTKLCVHYVPFDMERVSTYIHFDMTIYTTLQYVYYEMYTLYKIVCSISPIAMSFLML